MGMLLVSAMFLGTIFFVGVNQLAGSLELHGVELPRWFRLIVVALLVSAALSRIVGGAPTAPLRLPAAQHAMAAK